MTECPSNDEWRTLLGRDPAQADEERLTNHLEHCPACQESLEAMTSQLLENVRSVHSLADGPAPEFLRHFRSAVPDELAATTDADRASRSIRFPGPPTSLGPLGSLEHFHIRSELGNGATGFVYRAWDEKLERDVAIKVLRPESYSIELVRVRFEREARAASGIDEPHIIRVHEIRSLDGFPPYIVMDFIDGESLAQRLEREQSLPPRDAARLVRQVAHGLSAAHRLGLVHRDIKPSNILLTNDESGGVRAVITDFGLARATSLVDGGSRGRRTLSGETIGTPEYMSPEQIASPETIDGRSDLFSLGGVFFELLTGRPPFQAASVQDTLRVIRFEEPHAPRRLNAQVPRDLETICLKCLEKDPGRRFATSADLSAEIDRYLLGRPIQSRPIGAVERTWRWARRNPKLAAVGSVAVVALIATAAISIAFGLSQIRALKQAKLQSATLTFEKGLALCEKGEAGQGMLWMARGLEMAPDDAVAIRRLIEGNLAGWQKQVHPLKSVFELRSHVSAVAFSPDGRAFATGTTDGALQLFDTATGRPLTRFLHPDQVRAVAFSPDGRRLLTGCTDRSARLWEIASGTLLLPPIPHSGLVFAVGFGADGKTLISGSWPNTVQVWDSNTGQRIGEPIRADNKLLCLAISDDGESVATGSEDGRARIWSLQTRKPAGKPLQAGGPIFSVAVSPGNQILAAGTEHEVVVWDCASGERRPGEPMRHRAPILGITFSRNGRALLTGSDDKSAQLWDAETGRPLGAAIEHAGTVRSVALSPDGALVLTGSEDKTVRLWESVASQRRGRQLQHDKPVWAIAYSPDGKIAATGSQDKTARLWDVETGTARSEPLRHGGSVESVAFSPDGSSFVTGSVDYAARVWNASTARLLFPDPLRHDDEVTNVAFSPDGQFIVTSSADQSARVWDSKTGRRIALLRHDKTVFSAAFNSDGSKILTASNDRTARLWDARTGTPLAKFSHDHAVLAASISADDRVVVTGCADETGQIWDVATNSRRDPVLQHHGIVFAAALSPDGRLAATASTDNTARLWVVGTGAPVGDPLEHHGAVRCAVFSPDGRLVLTGGDDRMARLWDAATAKAYGPPFQHHGKVRTVAFSPSGRTCLIGTDQSAWIWDLPAVPSVSPASAVLRAQVLSGMDLDAAGSIRPLTASEWFQRRESLERLVANGSAAERRHDSQ